MLDTAMSVFVAAPHARHELVWFHELELPVSIFEVCAAGHGPAPNEAWIRGRLGS